MNYINKRKPSKEIKKTESIKRIDWNKLNKVDTKQSINIIHKKKDTYLGKQRTNSFSLIGAMTKSKENVDIYKNWINSLHAQRNAKFALLGKQKLKNIN